MALEPEQIPSRTCGCPDCIIDYPPHLYGDRPPQGVCHGMWQVRWRDADRRQRLKNLPTLADARGFLADVRRRSAA
ncbi:hypothetical protein [Streptomyces shenzhenensis]|uniref:Uncharacterized protein n=1 Tax=Streptomyces shenzhenensis TaxID=943815 RepID=A0A3M0I9U4_9ACTN|nr:hypothetical protein [Streptomyces shenzhenensis]RMB85584.1 hypothetical protein CTZ28_12385 [Streptomyces shenzhenensis]